MRINEHKRNYTKTQYKQNTKTQYKQYKTQCIQVHILPEHPHNCQNTHTYTHPHITKPTHTHTDILQNKLKTTTVQDTHQIK